MLFMTSEKEKGADREVCPTFASSIMCYVRTAADAGYFLNCGSQSACAANISSVIAWISSSEHTAAVSGS